MRAVLISLIAALTLAACASVQRYDAASDVHALLISIRDDDRQTFEAHVDRPALERQIEARLASEARRKGGDGLAALGAMFAQPLAQIAGDALIQPRAFRAVAEYYGYDPAKPIPGPFALASVLKPVADDQVCATRSKTGPCLLVFTREQGTWRLTGFDGDLKMLRTKL
jgi:ABC-type amino acid transport substrate-binding protein